MGENPCRRQVVSDNMEQKMRSGGVNSVCNFIPLEGIRITFCMSVVVHDVVELWCDIWWWSVKELWRGDGQTSPFSIHLSGRRYNTVRYCVNVITLLCECDYATVWMWLRYCVNVITWLMRPCGAVDLFVTSDKGGGKCVCQCLSVCLSVCLLARLLKNACMDLDEMLHVDRCSDMDELINFWARSGPDAGTGLLSPLSYKSINQSIWRIFIAPLKIKFHRGASTRRHNHTGTILNDI